MRGACVRAGAQGGSGRACCVAQGGDWNAQLKLGNSEFVGLNYLQSVTPRLALGGEAFWLGQQRKSGAGFAARHADDKHVATAQVATTGLVSLTYLRRISEKVRGPGRSGLAHAQPPCCTPACRLAGSFAPTLTMNDSSVMLFCFAWYFCQPHVRVCGRGRSVSPSSQLIDRVHDTGASMFLGGMPRKKECWTAGWTFTCCWLHAGVPGERVPVELELPGGQRGVWVRLRAAPVPPARPRRHRRQGNTSCIIPPAQYAMLKQSAG